MLITGLKCNWCRKTSPEIDTPPGWITICDEVDIRVYKPNSIEKQVLTLTDEMDFCSLDCFKQYLEKQYNDVINNNQPQKMIK
jgi:hypothetical protein